MSFGVHDDEERAARMYDRAMIIEKGRAAKTNFPLSEYEAEVSRYRAYCLQTCGPDLPQCMQPWSPFCCSP